jgi:hypothetical protein
VQQDGDDAAGTESSDVPADAEDEVRDCLLFFRQATEDKIEEARRGKQKEEARRGKTRQEYTNRRQEETSKGKKMQEEASSSKKRQTETRGGNKRQAEARRSKKRQVEASRNKKG